ALFHWWEMRANGYIVVGDNRKLALDFVPVTTFVGNQLVISRTQIFDVAMSGVDAEVGVCLPWLTQFRPRVYFGYYHYSAQEKQTINGWRGRFEAAITPHVSMHFAIQNDAVFDTTVNGGLAFHLGGTPRCRDFESNYRSAEDRLGQRVVRDVNIAMIQERVDGEDRFDRDGPGFPPNGSGSGGNGGGNGGGGSGGGGSGGGG